MNAIRAKPVAAADSSSLCRSGNARTAVGTVGSRWTVMRTARSTFESGSLPGWWPHTGDPVRCAAVFTATPQRLITLRKAESHGLYLDTAHATRARPRGR